jgi:hypothetical protein
VGRCKRPGNKYCELLRERQMVSRSHHSCCGRRATRSGFSRIAHNWGANWKRINGVRDEGPKSNSPEFFLKSIKRTVENLDSIKSSPTPAIAKLGLTESTSFIGAQ